MENEVMNKVEDVAEVVCDEASNVELGKGLLIGGVIIGGVIVVVNLARKALKNHNAKKSSGVIKFKKKAETKEDDDVVVMDSTEETENE